MSAAVIAATVAVIAANSGHHATTKSGAVGVIIIYIVGWVIIAIMIGNMLVRSRPPRKEVHRVEPRWCQTYEPAGVITLEMLQDPNVHPGRTNEFGVSVGQLRKLLQIEPVERV